MSYNNLAAVATIEIVKQIIEDAHPPLTWGPLMAKKAMSLYNLEAPRQGGEALYIVALSSAGRKGSPARSFVEQVWFTWRPEEVGRLGRKARKENRSFQVVTLTTAETPWAEVVGLSPVGGKEAVEVEEDRGFGFFDRYSWLRGNPDQAWALRSAQACMHEVAEWRKAADRALGEYPWGACNTL